MNFFSIFWCSDICSHPKEDIALNDNRTSETVELFCNPALIWPPTGGGLLNLPNPVQNPYFFLAKFSQISFGTATNFLLVAVPKLISHFGEISHQKKRWRVVLTIVFFFFFFNSLKKSCTISSSKNKKEKSDAISLFSLKIHSSIFWLEQRDLRKLKKKNQTH